MGCGGRGKTKHWGGKRRKEGWEELVKSLETSLLSGSSGDEGESIGEIGRNPYLVRAREGGELSRAWHGAGISRVREI